MVYVRYTRDVELLEVSEDYMKLSESIDVSFDDFLRMLSFVWGPVAVEVQGETRSGGFSTRALIAPVVDGDKDYFGLGDAVDVPLIVREVARVKSIGYLRMDGSVRHLTEPYKRLFVKVGVPKLGIEFVVEWYKKRTAKAYVPSDIAERITDVLRKYAERGTRALKPTDLVARLHSNGFRRRVDAEYACSAISTFMRCDCDVGRLYMYEGEFSWQHHYLYAVGDPLPFREYVEPCKCKYSVDEKAKRVWFDYLYVPERLCVFMKRFGGGD